MSITDPRGFLAAGVAAGIKTSGDLDLALVVNQGPRFDAAGVFTSNRVFAAPVAWSRQALADGQLKAVVLNSGGANACTGEPDYQDAAATAAQVAELLGCADTDVGVCSTG
ncbi:MAG: bifunctional ornithine acetyltransferase/N-acetylglutamate synthase, partial [Brooklawnia sp.]